MATYDLTACRQVSGSRAIPIQDPNTQFIGKLPNSPAIEDITSQCSMMRDVGPETCASLTARHPPGVGRLKSLALGNELHDFGSLRRNPNFKKGKPQRSTRQRPAKVQAKAVKTALYAAETRAGVVREPSRQWRNNWFPPTDRWKQPGNRVSIACVPTQATDLQRRRTLERSECVCGRRRAAATTARPFWGESRAEEVASPCDERAPPTLFGRPAA